MHHLDRALYTLEGIDRAAYLDNSRFRGIEDHPPFRLHMTADPHGRPNVQYHSTELRSNGYPAATYAASESDTEPDGDPDHPWLDPRPAASAGSAGLAHFTMHSDGTITNNLSGRRFQLQPVSEDGRPVDARLEDELGDTTDVRTSIAADADRVVYGDREDSYGHPRDNFTRCAIIWTGLLTDKLADGEHITPQDVARLQIGMKLSRDVAEPKRDNRVDMAGYAITLDRLETGQ